jgi:hypothetical protein
MAAITPMIAASTSANAIASIGRVRVSVRADDSLFAILTSGGKGPDLWRR